MQATADGLAACIDTQSRAEPSLHLTGDSSRVLRARNDSGAVALCGSGVISTQPIAEADDIRGISAWIRALVAAQRSFAYQQHWSTVAGCTLSGSRCPVANRTCLLRLKDG